MKKRNRWAALLLALACAGSLAACQEKQADEPEEQYDAKPVVYLYPEEETEVTVTLDFDGTLIVVSHDRDFLDGLVTKVYEFGHQRVREHLCGIYEFLETKKMENLQELEKKA